MKNLTSKILILLFAAASISTTYITAADMSSTGNRNPQFCQFLKNRDRIRLQKKDGTCIQKKDGTGNKNKMNKKNQFNKKNKMNKKSGNGNRNGRGR